MDRGATLRNLHVAMKDLLHIPVNDDKIHHATGVARNEERSTSTPANE
jgi:hypothetical protein